jgi:hypothetical protein
VEKLKANAATSRVGFSRVVTGVGAIPPSWVFKHRTLLRFVEPEEAPSAAGVVRRGWHGVHRLSLTGPSTCGERVRVARRIHHSPRPTTSLMEPFTIQNEIPITTDDVSACHSAFGSVAMTDYRTPTGLWICHVGWSSACTADGSVCSSSNSKDLTNKQGPISAWVEMGVWIGWAVFQRFSVSWRLRHFAAGSDAWLPHVRTWQRPPTSSSDWRSLVGG